MEAVGIHEFDDSNVIPLENKTRLLKSSSIYGANASGKSNIIKALAFMVNHVKTSAKEMQTGDAAGLEPFLLDKECLSEPSFFEVEFVYGGDKYRYGFTLNNVPGHALSWDSEIGGNTLQDNIAAEWLYLTAAKEFPLFIRENNELIKLSPQFPEGNVWRKMTAKTGVGLRSNALFISTLGQLFGSTSEKESHSNRVISWINKIQLINGLNDERIMNFTLNAIRSKKYIE